MAGGFPCGASSRQGREALNHGRSSILRKLHPRFVGECNSQVGVSLEGFLVEVKWRGEGRFCSEGNGLPITRVIHLEEKLGVSLHFQNLES